MHHRVPKPSFLPDETPRYFLMRVHYYHVKEQILQASRKADKVSPQYANIRLLPDLSRHTLQRCRNLETITKALGNHKILHKWKYPATLSITHNRVTILISTLEEGITALQKWDILPDHATRYSPPEGPRSIHNEWQVVSHKHSHKKIAGGNLLR